MSYLRIHRAWSNGDTIELDLPMHISLTTWRTNADSVSVNRGPLTYSLKIGEKPHRYGGTDEWPALELLPTSPWNYGLVLDEADPASSFKIVRKPGPIAAQPFDADAAPIELTAKARRIPAWTLDQFGLAAPLQSSPAKSTEPIETITLIPMGCARLRISAFPTVSQDPNANEWISPAR